jgi:hypothetical protein
MSVIPVHCPLALAAHFTNSTPECLPWNGHFTWRSLPGTCLTLDSIPLYARRKELVVVKATLHGENGTVLPLCLKLRSHLHTHDNELATYTALLHHGDVHRAFVPLQAAFQFHTSDGTCWGALCMPFLPCTLANVLSVSPKPTAPLDMACLSDRFHSHLHTVSSVHPPEMHPDGGMSLRTAQGCMEMVLLEACFQLLHFVHTRGWVHGDAHLGNFLLDTQSWRIYLIDMERTFQSADPTQYLLDAQELFGHCTGLLLSLSRPSAWDMSDVWSVMARMHPKSKTPSTIPLLHYTPVCTCFIHDDVPSREHGCVMCKSSANLAIAERYLVEAPAWACKTKRVDFEDLLYHIKLSRLDARQTLEDIACALLAHWQTIKPRLLVPSSSVRVHRFRSKMLRVFAMRCHSAQTNSWLAYILHKGMLVPNGHKNAISLARMLHRSKLSKWAEKVLAIASLPQ